MGYVADFLDIFGIFIFREPEAFWRLFFLTTLIRNINYLTYNYVRTHCWFHGLANTHRYFRRLHCQPYYERWGKRMLHEPHCRYHWQLCRNIHQPSAEHRVVRQGVSYQLCVLCLRRSNRVVDLEKAVWLNMMTIHLKNAYEFGKRLAAKCD